MKDGKYKIRYKPQQLYNDKASCRWTRRSSHADDVAHAKPNDNEYAALENFYGRDGPLDVGLKPGEAQSAAWRAAASMTGLGTPSNRTRSARCTMSACYYTALMRGEQLEGNAARV